MRRRARFSIWSGKMADDLTVGRIGEAPLRAEPPPALRHDQPGPGARSSPGHPNPTLRLDPQLGVVVVAFHDDQGAVTNTIPTQQQLDAYRTWERTGTGKPPAGTEI